MAGRAPSVSRRLIEAHVRRPPAGSAVPGADVLTPREVEVWRLVTAGRSNAEIAAELFLGEATVKTHVSRLIAKLGARDRIQLVVFGFESASLTDPVRGQDPRVGLPGAADVCVAQCAVSGYGAGVRKPFLGDQGRAQVSSGSLPS
jgi:DNA-binding CsgD family transcriptional regulator